MILETSQEIPGILIFFNSKISQIKTSQGFEHTRTFYYLYFLTSNQLSTS